MTRPCRKGLVLDEHLGSMSDLGSILFVNGKFVSEHHAGLSPLDRGFTLGDGVFDTLVAIGDSFFRIDDHLDRLNVGARLLDIRIPEREQLINNMTRTVRLNGFMYSIIRITITRGISQVRGLDVIAGGDPSVIIKVSKWNGPLDSLPDGRHLVLSNVPRNDLSPLSVIKTLSYTDGVLARLQARQVGADDAIMANTRGSITGATSSNVFAVMGGILVTPPIDDGALPGIARKTILEEARHLSITVKEISVTAQTILSAEEVFISNVVTGIVPVVCLFSNSVGAGIAGPVTGKLASSYWRRVLLDN